jgi:hypothetical protein
LRATINAAIIALPRHRILILIVGRISSSLPRYTLIAPPDGIAAIDNKFGTPGLDIFHDFLGHPLATVKSEYRPMHPGKPLHVFNGCFGDPTLIHR